MEDGEPIRSSDLTDPLHTLSGLSLIRRELRGFKDALKSAYAEDLECIREVMRSLVLQNPKKHLDQAKTAVDSIKDLPISDLADFITTTKESEAVAANKKENLPARRPGLGLGRERPHFSMKPELRQLSELAESTFDIRKLEDPAEYFAACERREIAEKELRRLRGECVSVLENYNLPRPERQRRPGILGRQATYKHIYPTDGTVMPSQETLVKGVLSQENCNSRLETVASHAAVKEKELTGKIAVKEGRVSRLLDELLFDCENLEEEMWERLQIKRSEREKSPVPDFHYGENDVMDFVENLQKSRIAISDTKNVGRGVSGEMPAKPEQVEKRLSQYLGSRHLPKSPFASISSLNRRIQQSNPSNDPFSALDLSSARNFSSPGDSNQQSNHLVIRKESIASSPSKSNLRVENMGSLELIKGKTILLNDKLVKDQSGGSDAGTNSGPSATHNDINENNFVEHVVERNTDADFGVDTTNEIEKNVDDVGQEAMLLVRVDENLEESSRHHTGFQTAGSTESEENVVVMSQIAEHSIISDSTVEKMKSKEHITDYRSLAAVGPSSICEDIPVQQSHNMEEPSLMPMKDQNTVKVPVRNGRKRKEIQELADLPLNDQSKADKPARSGRKRKEVSRRQSLAAAGTHWEGEVRRSRRIKIKPLEYWKGERFLYGCIHESLATVIGLKYASPAKDLKSPIWRVKSYVSDEYKELVDFAALH